MSTPRIIAIGGGKGGVGKSVVASNLAVAFARAGARTVLVDADLGAANLHTMFGVDRAGPTLHALVRGTVNNLDDILVETQTPNLRLGPGCGAIPGAANLLPEDKARLLKAITRTDADVLLIDVGAGISYDVIDLYNLADLRLVVLLPQLTSFQNAYAFLKSAVHRGIESCADDQARRAIYRRSAPATETDKISTVIARIAAEDPVYGQRAQSYLDHFGVELIGNQITSPKERATLGGVAKMFQDFLGFESTQLGYVRFNRRITESINARRPLIQLDPFDDCARSFTQMAQALLHRDVEALRRGRTGRGAEDSAFASDLRALLRA